MLAKQLIDLVHAMHLGSNDGLVDSTCLLKENRSHSLLLLILQYHYQQGVNEESWNYTELRISETITVSIMRSFLSFQERKEKKKSMRNLDFSSQLKTIRFNVFKVLSFLLVVDTLESKMLLDLQIQKKQFAHQLVYVADLNYPPFSCLISSLNSEIACYKDYHTLLPINLNSQPFPVVQQYSIINATNPLSFFIIPLSFCSTIT